MKKLLSVLLVMAVVMSFATVMSVSADEKEDLVAAGSSGMAVNFGNNSMQGSVLVNMDRQEAGTDIVLTDASGTELINWQTSKKYTSVVISCPGIAQGESYTLKAGTSKTTVTMDSLIYGTGNTMGR